MPEFYIVIFAAGLASFWADEPIRSFPAPVSVASTSHLVFGINHLRISALSNRRSLYFISTLSQERKRGVEMVHEGRQPRLALLHPLATSAPDSDDDGFLVFAEDAAEGVGDFADGGVGFDGGEDGGKEIFIRGSSALEFGEGGLEARGIAPGAKSVQAGDLGALGFGVDAQRGNAALFFRNEIIHADYDLFFRFHRVLEVVGSFLDFSLDEASFNGAQHSSHRVYFLNVI